MMSENGLDLSTSRRKFFKLMAGAGVAGQVLLTPGCSVSGKTEAKETRVAGDPAPMTYRRLGRTHFESSRLVFGCGAALAGGKNARLLDRAFDAGINHYDVGSNIYYKGAERNLAPFLKKHRDKVFLVSKAPPLVRLKPHDSITVDQAKRAAQSWLDLMDDSLEQLQQEHVDAYYIFSANNPSLIRCEEMYNAFLSAKKAGKVDYFGFSSHKNAQKVMEAAIETGWYDLAMIGITPGGWYDYEVKNFAAGTPSLIGLEGTLAKARAAGMGLVAMKAVRHMAGLWSGGTGDTSAFDKFYNEKFMKSPLNAFQRSYAYVLEHGLDVVNADMQNFKHLEENIVAASTSSLYS